MLVTENLSGTGISINYYETRLDIVALAFFLVDSLIVTSSALTTGWTREAMCRSLTTGVFEYRKGGEKIACGCWSTCLRRFGWCAITLLVFAAYAAWILAALTAMFCFCIFFISWCAVTACQLGEEDTEFFFHVLNKRLSVASLGEVKYDEYCDRTVRQHT